MKKRMVILMAVLMTVGLCACGTGSKPAAAPDQGSVVAAELSAEDEKSDDAAPAQEQKDEQKDNQKDDQKADQKTEQKTDQKAEDKQSEPTSTVDGNVEKPAAAEDGKTAADYPGPMIADIVNPRGDIVTVSKQDDGTYTDKDNNVYKFDGTSVWTDENGAEWDETLDSAEANNAVETPGPDTAKIVNLRGDETTVYKLVDGTYMDRANTVFIYNSADNTWKEDGTEVIWDEALN